MTPQAALGHALRVRRRGRFMHECHSKNKGHPFGCPLFLEVTPGFEPGNEGFADLCLTTWLCHHMDKRSKILLLLSFGAGDGARTRYLHLGKVALYQMSYARIMRSLLTAHGASGRSRTNDTRIFNPLLYQLSYRGISDIRDIRRNGDPERARTVDLQRDRLAF